MRDESERRGGVAEEGILLGGMLEEKKLLDELGRKAREGKSMASKSKTPPSSFTSAFARPCSASTLILQENC